jgi:hypothetical protein
MSLVVGEEGFEREGLKKEYVYVFSLLKEMFRRFRRLVHVSSVGTEAVENLKREFVLLVILLEPMC